MFFQKISLKFSAKKFLVNFYFDLFVQKDPDFFKKFNKTKFFTKIYLIKLFLNGYSKYICI